MDEAEVGMKVVLKSGGPEMTILRIIGESERHAKMDELLKMKGYSDDDVYCQWMIDERSGKIKKDAFKLCMLKPFGEIKLNKGEPEDEKEEEEDFDF
ncbi:MAG: hypothetical protein ACI94Y_001632 [Maribacter sp.]|jgi:uncharacterized protein YodC (DUF2158 family)